MSSSYDVGWVDVRNSGMVWLQQAVSWRILMQWGGLLVSHHMSRWCHCSLHGRLNIMAEDCEGTGSRLWETRLVQSWIHQLHSQADSPGKVVTQ